MAISGIDLSIREGECIAILGENGSGKTTLVKHINGLLKPSSGSVLLSGEDIKGKTIAEIARKVGFVFQNPDHMIFADTVEEEVSFGPRNFAMDPEKIKEKVSQILAFTRLEQYRDTHPMSLSGGEKQRLALASIIVSDPEVLILDEPTTGLDFKSVNSMIALIREIRDRGKTIILITHDMGLVSHVAERVVLMKDGAIIKDGTLKEVFSDEDALGLTFLEQPYALKLSLAWNRGANITPDELVNAILEEER
ncbi:MAG: ABC transporter ATP-binding protein [Candidatus Methanofastidiosa archaeon]|nr:ABC transporter ATP-binding protein [Candidatus Methanofastidiosa archaeon]